MNHSHSSTQVPFMLAAFIAVVLYSFTAESNVAEQTPEMNKTADNIQIEPLQNKPLKVKLDVEV